MWHIFREKSYIFSEKSLIFSEKSYIFSEKTFIFSGMSLLSERPSYKSCTATNISSLLCMIIFIRTGMTVLLSRYLHFGRHFHAVGSQHVGIMQHTNERTLLECCLESVALSATLLCYVEHSHVPANSQELFLF